MEPTKEYELGKQAGFEAGLKQGRQEVVGWLENESGFGIPLALTDEAQRIWQAKKKEWGIK